MMTCVAIDDEPLALDVIRKHVGDIPFLELTATFTDGLRGLEYLRAHPVDLLVIDIRMPDISGIRIVQSLPDPPMVIFTTAWSEYAVQGFELEAIDYLVKPVRFTRFLQAVEKAQKFSEMRKSLTVGKEEGFMFVKSGYGTVRVNFGEIRFIEGLDDYIRIHFTDGRTPVMSLMSLKSILERLPEGRFLRVHRSFIVAVKLIGSIRRKVIMVGSDRIPVGDTYADAVNEWLAKR